MINDRARLGSFLSGTNWYSSTDRRGAGSPGTARA